MKWEDAICSVLAAEGKQMDYKDITKMILKKGYKTDSFDKAEKIVNSTLWTRSKEPVFRKVDVGTYELIWTSVTPTLFHKIVTDKTVDLRPCTLYDPDDPKYKRASGESGFVDSSALSELEKEFLELIVNFRLPLVSGEVCFADILDNLKVEILEKGEIPEEEGNRTQLVDAALLRKRLNELKKQIDKNSNDPEFMEKYDQRMRSVVKEAEQLLGGTSGEKVVKISILPLGKFFPGSKESKPKVVIYYENIKNIIRGSEEPCWSVMAGVFVHEMFHAWNYFNAGRGSVMEIDEPMVEFATLYFLKELEAFTRLQPYHLSDKVSNGNVSCVMVNRKNRVQNKQQSIGDVAAYGFGYYLFEELSKSDVCSRVWIETYSEESASIKNRDGKLLKKVKTALIPIYPFLSEGKVMGWFENIIFDGETIFATAGKSPTAKTDSHAFLRKLVLACIKKIGCKCFDAKELYAFEPIFKVCVPQCKDLENALKQQLEELVKDGVLDALPDDRYSMK